jgi:hypothetical protein
MSILGHAAAALTGSAGAFGAVLKAFDSFDKNQSEMNRQFVRAWLLGFSADYQKWTSFFGELFQTLFGKKHLSLKCVGRSFMLSSALILTIYLIWLLKQPSLHPLRDALDREILLEAGFIFIIAGCISDYLSLWKTRILLTKSKLLHTGVSTAGLVFADFIATCLLYLASLLIALLARDLMVGANWNTMKEDATTILTYQNWYSTGSGPMLILLLAALLTSAWIWIYLVVAYAMRALSSVIPPLSKLTDFEAHPVRSIGYVAAGIGAGIVGLFTLITA